MAVTSGSPGSGKLVLRKPAEAAALFESTSMANCHSLTLSPGGTRIAVAATNAGSNGNGRNLDAMGQYANNSSPVHIWDLSPAG